LPTGAGTKTEWVPSTGANYACVDENPTWSDSDYISTDVSGEIDTYACNDVTGVGTIQSLWMYNRTASYGTPNNDYQNFVMRIGGTEYSGEGELVKSIAWSTHRQVFELSPATSSAWTSGEINAIELGVKMAA